MSRDLEPWGGEVHMPSWLRRLLHRPDPSADTDERAHERRQPADPDATVGQAVDRAVAGPMTEMYHEGRRERRARRRK